MKYILLFIFLFIPSIRASENALSCSYNDNGKTINFGYYITSEGKHTITNFVLNGESYDNYYDIIYDSELTLKCPAISVVHFFGDSNPYYFIARNRELITTNEIVYDDNNNIIGQVHSISNLYNSGSVEYVHYSSREIYASEGITDDVRKQMNNNIKAYASNACTYHEKQAITNYFYANDFNSMPNFSANDLFEVDNEKITLSSNCSEVARNLYKSIISVRHMLDDYANSKGDINKLTYLSLESSYLSGYAALTTLWFDNNVSEDTCGAISDDVRGILNSFFDIFRLVVVILTIFMVYLDGMKCLATKDDSETKKWISNTIKRMVILVICLMLPLIVNLVLDLLNRYMAGSLVEVNGECVKAVTGG